MKFPSEMFRPERLANLGLALAMAMVLGAMVIPLPAWLLDIGLVGNFTFAASLLAAALYAQEPLKLSSFPALLLFTTLLRLSLNISSTRLALAEGRAGDVIQAFGEVVVRGDYVVGAVVFAILTLVQFLVIARGAERVAEVSARFSLDALPGKQMSIDADLRAGALDQEQARRRRQELERESQMFGAMDGAMKFIKGDAIAGVVIVLVNLLGGTAVGMFQNNLSPSEALSTYALIAMGDGLVSQIPSLCIALSAGLLVTRVAGEGNRKSLGLDIASQVFGNSKVLWVSAGLCGGLALIPGMPHITLGFFAAAFIYLGLKQKEETVPAKADEPQVGEGATPQTVSPPSGVVPIALDLAVDLTPLAEEDGRRLTQLELNELRASLYAELGVRVPSIQVRAQAAYLASGRYALLMDEVPCAFGQVSADGLYAQQITLEDLELLGIRGEREVDPGTGRVRCKVPLEAKPLLAAAGVPYHSARVLILEHLASLLRSRATAFLGIQEVQLLLEELESVSPVLVKEALQKVPLPLLTEVLRKLLEEQVSIKNLKLILESLVSPSTEGDANALAEKCRQSLHRYLTHKYAPQGPLFAYLVDPDIESALREGGAHGEGVDPDKIQGVLRAAQRIAAEGKAVVLTAPDVRRKLRKLCMGLQPSLPVLTYLELDPDLQIRPIGRLGS